jgi:hypothetical protein
LDIAHSSERKETLDMCIVLYCYCMIDRTAWFGKASRCFGCGDGWATTTLPIIDWFTEFAVDLAGLITASIFHVIVGIELPFPFCCRHTKDE